MNVLDMLLQTDESKLARPTKEVELKRLSEMFGEKFILVCEALSHDKYEEIQNIAVSYTADGKDVDVKMGDASVMTVIEAVKDKEGNKIFKNEDLMKHFKAATPKELVKTLLLSGEVMSLYNVVSKLTGYGDESVEEIKN